MNSRASSPVIKRLADRVTRAAGSHPKPDHAATGGGGRAWIKIAHAAITESGQRALDVEDVPHHSAAPSRALRPAWVILTQATCIFGPRFLML